jgi:hypothetical protein
MELKTWIESERGRGMFLAKALTAENPSRPVAQAFVYAMAVKGMNGSRPVPARLAPAIERITSSAVMRWDLRPDDWWEIWPELKDRRGAPEVPELVEKTVAIPA